MKLPEPYTAAAEKTDYIGIPLKNMKTDAVINAQLYIKVGSDHYVKYRDTSLEFDEKIRRRLEERDQTHLYVQADDTKSLSSYLESNLKSALENENLELKEKAEVLYETTIYLVRELLADPRSKELVRQSKRLVESTVQFILSDRSIFRHLIDLSKVDYYTYSHCTDVLTYAVLLGKRLGLRDGQEILDLGQSAILHDIGKAFVNPEITLKPGPLTEEEFAEMKNHSVYGYTVLSSTGELNRQVLHAVRHHHEDLTRSGYPQRLSATEIGLDVRIITCADIFSAMTTRRVYRKAYQVFPALTAMKEMVGKKIDQRVFREFVMMLGEA